MAHYELDEQTLKKFGVPQDFMEMFDGVFRGEDGGVYILNHGKMHFLDDKAYALKVEYVKAELPKTIAKLKEQLSPLNSPMKESKLGRAVKAYMAQAKKADIAFALADTYPNPVFTKTDDGYKQLPTQELFDHRQIICMGKMLIKQTDKYLCVDMIPIFVQPEYVIFWGGNSELFTATSGYTLSGYRKGYRNMVFRSLGIFKKLTKTNVGYLLEVQALPVRDHINTLYYLGEKVSRIAGTPLSKNGFIINKENGEVFAHTATYVFENGTYHKKQS
ncbi:MAG: hypothetical protein J6W11_01125 [Alphaproteobacteria bacterium]|nr:hypothetical protein [Alphaproteobacteria bacterium]